MGKYLLLCAVLFLSNRNIAQNGYNITVTLKPFANKYVYLGYYYGTTLKPIKDSIKLDNLGKGVFKGKEKLPGGIYLLGYPNKSNFIELPIGKSQSFSLTADPDNVLKTISYANNAEATEFVAYQRYMSEKEVELKAAKAKDENDKKTPEKISKEVEIFRTNIMKKNPTGLLTAVFNTMKEPVIPDAKLHPGGKYDSTYAWSFYKNNYWKSVNLADERLLRTPVFENKLDNFFQNIVYPNSDSIKKDVDKVLLAALKNKEMFKYISNKLVERYVNPQIMGQDAVYVHIYQNYIAPTTMNWFDEKQTKFLSDRYYFLVGNLIGEPAAQLDLIDTSGKPVSLYGIQAPYTIIAFWDATCGHCKEVVPKLDSVYVNKWKAKGVKLLGVMTDGGLEAYKNYIVEHKFSSWIHGYQTDEQRKADYAANRPNFRQQYDISSTPKLFLLDEQKRIKAKQVTWDQIDKILDDLTSKK